MKKIIFLFVVTILTTSIAVAQNRGGQRDFDPEERAKSQTKELTELLDLKKDQEKKVYELNLKAGKEMAAMRDEMRSGGGDRDAMREKMMDMREKQNKEMKKILTDSQYKKYQKYLEERRAQRGQGRG